MILRQCRPSRAAAESAQDSDLEPPTTVEVVDTNPAADPVGHRPPPENSESHLGPVSDVGLGEGEIAAPGVDPSTDAMESTDGDGSFEGRDPLRFSNWMKRSTTGAILTGITIGLQQALEVPRKQPAFVIEANDEPDDSERPIELRFDPDSPTKTVAIIRLPPAPDPSGPS